MWYLSFRQLSIFQPNIYKYIHQFSLTIKALIFEFNSSFRCIILETKSRYDCALCSLMKETVPSVTVKELGETEMVEVEQIRCARKSPFLFCSKDWGKKF
jgi:hypothetical protein